MTGTWNNDTIQAKSTSARGPKIGAYFDLEVAKVEETFGVSIAISFISIDQVSSEGESSIVHFFLSFFFLFLFFQSLQILFHFCPA